MNQPEKDPIKDLFAGMQPEQPSADFTDRLMSRIETPAVANTSQPIEFTPLISRGGWLGIAAGVAAIIAVSYFSDPQNSLVFHQISFDWIPRFELDFSLGLSAKTLLIVASCTATGWGLVVADRVFNSSTAS